VVVLTKMKPEQAEPLIAHFKKEVLGHMPRGRVTVLAVPFLTAEELEDPATRATRYRIPLINQFAVLGEDAGLLRRQSASVAVKHLRHNCDALLSVARDDVAALEDWGRLVERGRSEFLDRYRREYLTGAKFHRFDEALVKLVEMLDFPGVGKVLSSALFVVRTPYRLVKGLLGNMFGTPPAASIPEQPVLEAGFQAWSDQIRATALTAEKQHELWARVAQAFEGDFGKQMQEHFRNGMTAFQGSQRAEIDATARAIYEDLEQSPNTLNALRGSKFALDVAAIAGTVAMGGINVQDLVLVPLAAGISHQLVEWLGAGYVEVQKEKARTRQQELVARHVADPLATWLTQWPATGGTEFERLQLALNRIPPSLDRLVEALQP
jgi:hypothetical protein